MQNLIEEPMINYLKKANQDYLNLMNEAEGDL